MTIFIAILLGLVQGLCEFLPVSSSGHLVLLHKLFGIEEGALFFTIMLHLGTLLAVFAVYYKEIFALLRHPFQRRTIMYIAALLPTVAIALLFSDFFKDSYSGRYLGFGFLLTAVILTLSNKWKNGKKTIDSMRISNAALIGAMQGVAILPGVSRSGSTIAGALFSGLDKSAAAEFSFLLSIPAILGSVVFELPALLESGVESVNWLYTIAGMLSAAVSGYFAIRFMLNIIKKRRMLPFAVYVAILGALIILDQFVTRLYF